MRGRGQSRGQDAVTGEAAHHLDGLCHLEADHDDCEAPAAHGADGDLAFLLACALDLFLLALEALDDGCVGAFDVAHLGTTVEDAHVIELGEEHVLVLCAERVGGREAGEEVRESADLAADAVVRVVVVAVLDVVAAHDGDLAMSGIALPLQEVDLAGEVRRSESVSG